MVNCPFCQSPLALFLNGYICSNDDLCEYSYQQDIHTYTDTSGGFIYYNYKPDTQKLFVRFIHSTQYYVFSCPSLEYFVNFVRNKGKRLQDLKTLL